MKADPATIPDDKNDATVADLTDTNDGGPVLKCTLSTEGNPKEEKRRSPRSASGSVLKRQLDEGTGSGELGVNAKRPRLMTVSDGAVPTSESSTSSPSPLNGSSTPDSNKRKTPHNVGGVADDEGDTNQAEEPPAKRVRLDGPPDVNLIQDNITPKPSPITCLPLEILAEVLLFTQSPLTLLAVCRTCKSLCDQLLSPDASFIWKKTRIAVRLPDPEAFDGTLEGNEPSTSVTGVKYFLGREAAYMAWVFDGGVCESCTEETERMYISFSLRLRTCEKEDCFEAVKKQLLYETRDYKGSHSWSTIPVLESSSLLPDHLTDQTAIWPDTFKASRAKLIQTATEKYANRGKEEIDRARARTNTWMKFCVALYTWKKDWEKALRLLKEANGIMAEEFAKREGWDYSDMCATNSVNELFEDKSKRRESCQMTELTKLRPTIAKELFQLQEGRKQKEMANIRNANRTHVWKLYQKFMSKRVEYPFLPSFSSFLKLPAIELLQSSHLVAAKIRTKTVVTGDSFVSTMVKQQIEQWVEQAKHDLLDSLGCSEEWREMVPALQMPHPALRLDARWKCRVCNQVEKKYEMDGCLDFAGVCQHECQEQGNKSRRTGATTPWQIANFVRDEQACSVMRTYLDRRRPDTAETGETSTFLKSTVWLCKSCNPPLVVRAGSLIGHSHRHATPMKISYLLRFGSITWLNLFGLTQWLLTDKKNSPKWTQKNIYVCNYCHNIDAEAQAQEKRDEDEPSGAGLTKQETPDSGMNETEATQTETTQTETTKVAENTEQHNSGKAKGKTSNRFRFHGLRCHLNSKHEIRQIRDEDYHCNELVSDFYDEQDQTLIDVLICSLNIDELS